MKIIQKDNFLNWINSFNNLMIQSQQYKIDESNIKKKEFIEKLNEFKNEDILRDIIDMEEVLKEILLSNNKKEISEKKENIKIIFTKSDLTDEKVIEKIDKVKLFIDNDLKNIKKKNDLSLISAYKTFLNNYKYIVLKRKDK
jgi:hypothetical protein